MEEVVAPVLHEYDVKPPAALSVIDPTDAQRAVSWLKKVESLSTCSKRKVSTRTEQATDAYRI
jgi:hypothetical protein